MAEQKKKKTNSPSKTKEDERPPTTPDPSMNLPAKAAEQPTIQRADENIPAYRITTQLIKQHWGSIVGMQREDAVIIARTIHENFPMFGPWSVINNFDVLAGKTLYMNANGYIDIAMSHPMTASPPILRQIQHGSQDWADFLGDISPDEIAAAYVCEFYRKDREIPFVEANYCPMSDDLLYQGKKSDPKRKLKPDWKPLAMKIARTRAIRRCLRFAFSPSEAAALYAEKKIGAVLEQAARRELPKPVASPEDPYRPDAGDEQRDWSDQEFDPDVVAITEMERRKLHALVERLNTGDLSPHEAIKDAMAGLIMEQTGEIVDHNKLTTKNITYGDYAVLISRLHELYPFKDREVEEVEATVEGQEELAL